MIYVPLDSIMSKWYGESEKNLGKIFDAAEELGDSIVFIDEVDALATRRSGNMHEATRRLLSVRGGVRASSAIISDSHI
jgi:SpoVK/Ycf46/Vps4 family AAA+-type ATPase